LTHKVGHLEPAAHGAKQQLEQVQTECDQLKSRLRDLQSIAKAAACSTEGIVLVDLKGIIRFANDAWAKMCGHFSAAQLRDKSITDCFSQEQMKSWIIPCMTRARRGETAECLVGRDGAKSCWYVRMTPREDEQGKCTGIVVFAADQTEQNQLREQLKRSSDSERAAKEQLAKVHRQSEQSASQVRSELCLAREDLNKRAADYGRFEAELEILRGQLAQRTSELQTATEQLRRQTAARIQTEQASEKQASELQSANERVRTLTTESGKLTRALNEASENIKKLSQQLAATKTLAPRLRYLSEVAEQSAEGIVVTDLTGVVRFANAAWARMHGYGGVASLVGQPIGAFYAPDRVKSRILHCMEQAKAGQAAESSVEVVRKDGSRFATRVRVVAVTGDADKCIGYILFATDASRDKHTDVHLAATKEQLAKQTAELTLLDDKYRKLENDHNSLADELSRVRNQLDDRTAELNITIEHLERRTAERAELERRNKQLADDFAVAKDQAAEAQSRSRQLENDLVESRRRLKQQETELTVASEQLEEQGGQLTEAIEQLEQRSADLKRTGEQLQMEQTERERLTGELRAVREEREQVRCELKAAQERLEQETSLRLSSQTTVEQQLKDKTAQLNAVIDRADGQVSRLRTAEEQLRKTEAERKRLADELEQCRYDLNRLSAQFKAANEQLEQGTAQFVQTDERLQRHSLELKAAKDKLEKQNSKCDRLEKELQKSRAQLEQYRCELAEANKRLKEESAARNSLEHEQSRLVETQTATSNDQLAGAKAECDRLTRELSEYRGRFDKQAAETAELQERLEQETVRRVQAEQQLAQQVEELDDSNKKLEKELIQVRKIEGEFRQYQDRYERLKRQREPCPPAARLEPGRESEPRPADGKPSAAPAPSHGPQWPPEQGWPEQAEDEDLADFDAPTADEAGGIDVSDQTHDTGTIPAQGGPFDYKDLEALADLAEKLRQPPTSDEISQSGSIWAAESAGGGSDFKKPDARSSDDGVEDGNERPESATGHDDLLQRMRAGKALSQRIVGLQRLLVYLLRRF
jgi:PAS domain S-box-containing protein